MRALPTLGPGTCCPATHVCPVLCPSVLLKSAWGESPPLWSCSLMSLLCKDASIHCTTGWSSVNRRAHLSMSWGPSPTENMEQYREPASRRIGGYVFPKNGLSSWEGYPSIGPGKYGHSWSELYSVLSPLITIPLQCSSVIGSCASTQHSTLPAEFLGQLIAGRAVSSIGGVVAHLSPFLSSLIPTCNFPYPRLMRWFSTYFCAPVSSPICTSMYREQKWKGCLQPQTSTRWP